MGWVFDKELGVKRVPDEAAISRPGPVQFNGVDCAVLAARYVAHRKAMAAASPDTRDETAAQTPAP